MLSLDAEPRRIGRPSLLALDDSRARTTIVVESSMLNSMMILIVLIEVWLAWKIGFWTRLQSRLSRLRSLNWTRDSAELSFDKSDQRARFAMKALGGLFGALWIFSHLTILRSTQLIVLSAAVGLAFLARTRRLPRRSAMFGFGGLFALLFVLPYVVGGRMDVPNRPPSLADGKTGASPICPQLPGERDDASIRTPAYDPSDDRFDVSIDMLERTTTLHRWLGWAGFGRVEDYNVLASLYEQRREYPKSFGLYKEAADEGDKYGEFNVGRFYLDGRSPVKKPEAALEYLQFAADQNLGPAQYDLGVMYADGIGVKCDVSQAIALWFQAGRQGNAAAIAALGLRDLGHAQAMLERAPIDMDFADPDTVIGAERKLMTFAAGFDAKRSLPDEKRKATIDAVKQECSVGVERIEKNIEDSEYSQYDGLRSWHACYTKAESSLF